MQRTLLPLISLSVKHISIPLGTIDVCCVFKLCRCVGCMGLIEFEDLESALHMTVAQGKESGLYRGYVESEMHTKRKEELKKIARGKLAGIPGARERQRKRGKRG